MSGSAMLVTHWICYFLEFTLAWRYLLQIISPWVRGLQLCGFWKEWELAPGLHKVFISIFWKKWKIPFLRETIPWKSLIKTPNISIVDRKSECDRKTVTEKSLCHIQKLLQDQNVCQRKLFFRKQVSIREKISVTVKSCRLRKKFHHRHKFLSKKYLCQK